MLSLNIGQYKYNNYCRAQALSFGALKKSQFEGVDLNVVEKFKAPIEKFNSNEDFQNWASELCEKIVYNNKEVLASDLNSVRNERLIEWIDYLNKSKYKNSQKLLILSSITKDLNKDKSAAVPYLDTEILVDLMKKIDKITLEKPKNQFNFVKLYTHDFYDTQIKRLSNGEKWVYIPSLIHDKKNFSRNAEMLRILSARGWCTKNTKTEKYLSEGDMHIYKDGSRSELAIRFVGDEVVELQGYMNNYKIPLHFYSVLKDYLDKLGIKRFSPKAKKELDEVKEKTKKVNNLKNFLADAIKNDDAKTIYEKLGIKVKTDSNGNLILSQYSSSFDNWAFSFSDLGIDENKLFKKVVKIEGNADFTSSQLTSLYNLEKINGRADFFGAKIKDLGNLKNVSGTIHIEDCNITSFGMIEELKEHLVIKSSKIKDLGNLKRIGKNVMFINSIICDCKNLEKIGGIANFYGSTIKSTGKLKSIGKLLDVSLQEIKIPNKGYIECITKIKPQPKTEAAAL